MAQTTACPISPDNATQRGGKSSVPRIRAIAEVTGTVISTGTPAPQA
jgi:hypothetical protein